MSTKIYDTVYNKDENNNILSLIQKTKSDIVANREEYLDKFLNIIIKEFNFNSLNKISRNNIDEKRKDESWKNIFFSSLVFYNNDFERAYLNTDLSIVHYDFKKHNINLKGTLLQFFGMNKFSLKEKIEEMSGSRNFDYYNNTDMDIRDDEENLRRRTWNKIFKETSIPSKEGDVIIVYNFIEDYMENKDQIFQCIEKLLFNKLKNYKVTSREEHIYIKVKIDTAFKKINEEKGHGDEEKKENAMSQFLNAERNARECFKSNIPFTKDELKFVNYINDELKSSLDEVLKIENRSKIMNVFKLKMDESIEKTNANKIEAEKRFNDFEKEMENIKKNKLKKT